MSRTENTEPATLNHTGSRLSFTRRHPFFGFTILAFLKRMRHNVGNRIKLSKYFSKMCDPGEKTSYY